MEVPLSMWIAVVVLIHATVFGIFGVWVAGQCGRSESEGFWLGALFGAFGVIVEAMLPKYPYEKQVRDAAANEINVQAALLTEIKNELQWHRQQKEKENVRAKAAVHASKTEKR